MASPTPNKGMTYPAHGGAVDAWDTPLNTNFDQLDLNLGGYYPITVTSTASTATYNSSGATLSSTVATATLPTANAQNMYYSVSGTLTQNLTLAFPAVGSFYNINNNSSGAFTVTASVSGSSGTTVAIAQGGTNSILTDGTNVLLTNSNVLAKLQSFLGNPNGSVAGTVATANGGATDFEWDVTNRQLYAVTTTGTAVTTVWSPQISRLTPQGYLTVSADASNPIVASDTTSTTVRYVPFVGSWTVLSNGTILYPYQFSAMTLTLTGAQAANIIYDIFMVYNSGTPTIGTGPAWSVSTAGAGSRGAAVALTRLNGVWVNNLAITLTNNGAPIACGALEGVYLGSILVDSAAGNVSCLPAYGQSRKWGVWNAYNRQKIILQGGDSTASWTYNSTTPRPSNNDSNNTLIVLSCLPEEIIQIEFNENTQSNTVAANTPRIGIGVNSTTTVSGLSPRSPGSASILNNNMTAMYESIPTIGRNDYTMLEYLAAGTTTNTWFGTATEMVMTAEWNG